MAVHPADDAPPAAKRGRPTIDVAYAVHLVINEHLPIREALAKLNKIRESEEQKNVSVSKRGLALAREQQRQKSAAESGAIASAAAAARRRLAFNSAPIATCGGKKRKALLFNNVVFEMTDNLSDQRQARCSLTLIAETPTIPSPRRGLGAQAKRCGNGQRRTGTRRTSSARPSRRRRSCSTQPRRMA
jgi:hypothetical protein